MPEREFELYLSVLSRLLRLSPAQKDAIADELRDHLEERFEELVRSGKPRDEAIQQALDEFGDSAGMAGEFTALSRRRIRRIVMRSTLAVSTVAALIGFLLFNEAPLQNGIPGQLSAVAQDDGGTVKGVNEAQTARPEVPAGALLSHDDRIHEQLHSPTSGDFTDSPLSDVMEFLSALHDVPIALDQRDLDDFGISADEPVSIILEPFPAIDLSKAKTPEERIELLAKAKDRALPLHRALTWILKPLDLSWYVDEGVIRVTSVDAAEARMLSRSYYVGPLLRSGVSEQALVEAVEKMTSSSWQTLEGSGGAQALIGDVLSVRQTWQGHRELRALLEALGRRVPWQYVMDSDVQVPLQERLEATVESVEFVDSSLSDVVEFLAEVSATRIRFDYPGLEEEGIDSSEPVSITANKRTLRGILKHILKPIDCQAVVHDGGLIITTNVRAEEALHTVIYDVRDLINGLDQQYRLVRGILSTTNGPWEIVDGSGGAIMLFGEDRLLVRQTDEVHLEIRGLLSAQRQAKALSGDGAVNTKPTERPTGTLPAAQVETRLYRVPSTTAEDLMLSLPELVGEGTWKLEGGKGSRDPKVVGTIRKVEVGPKVVELPGRKADKASGAKAKGAKGDSADKNMAGDSVLIVPESVLVIQQTPAVHQKIDRFLQSLALETRGERLQDTPIGGFGGGIGGGGGGGFF